MTRYAEVPYPRPPVRRPIDTRHGASGLAERGLPSVVGSLHRGSEPGEKALKLCRVVDSDEAEHEWGGSVLVRVDQDWGRTPDDGWALDVRGVADEAVVVAAVAAAVLRGARAILTDDVVLAARTVVTAAAVLDARHSRRGHDGT